MTRNRFEARAAALLADRFAYESTKIHYTIESTYLPDWYDAASNTIIETKGYMRPSCRKTMLAVRRQHPDLRIIMVFSNPEQRITKASRTTYRQWCEKNGIEVLRIEELADL